MATIHLNRQQRHRVLAGHPWVFGNEIERIEGDPVPGDLVAVRDARGRGWGTGYWNPASQIAVRMLSHDPEQAVDDAFWDARLDAALAYRDTVLPGRPARRLVNSESDRLPGLIVDQYGPDLVVQATTLGIDRRLDALVDRLCTRLVPRAVIERNDVAVREREGLARRSGVIRGASDGAAAVRVGAAAFAFHLLDPHKTGFYLDQQRNYELVAAHVRPGMRVLDAFCHLGGFAIHAALAGAARVVAIDSAEDSIAGTRAAAERNGVAERIDARCANAFDELRALERAGERFDLVVLDPPSFTRTRDAVAGALRGYKEIHLRALRLLGPGGILATFSCSHHIGADAFQDVVLDAATDARRQLRREAVLGASPDHPVLPQVPESEYLKGLVLTAL